MNFENDKWNIADEEFNSWLNGNKQESSIDLTDILKSTYLVFRQKQRSWLKELSKRSWEYLNEKKNSIQFSLSDNIIKDAESDLIDDSLLDDVPMFRKCSKIDEPGYWERIRNEENQRIIKGVLSGDQQVFTELYEYELPKVIRLLKKNSGNIDMAKDVFQDALVIFIEKVYTDKLDLTCTVSTYLYSICRFLWMDQLRQYKREMPLKDEYSYLNVEITVAGFETTPDIFENVNNAIETLGDPCKQLLESYYYKNLGWDEIASSLGYASAASARNQKYKCLERIRKTVSCEEV